jgi:perosamine synthetase
MERIPIAGPWITQKEIDYVTDAATNAWYDNAWDYITRFEKAFADYLGMAHAVSLPSCTAALHLSLLAHNIGPGDEVIVPELTWIATSAPISYVGAIPRFADIDPKTWCLDPKSYEANITSKTKAVIPVDLYGNMPDWAGLAEVAQKHGVPIIEDAAEAVGSTYRGQLAGTFGHTGCFSFHGSKTMVTGEGGMLVTNDEDLYHRIQFQRDHGRKPGDVTFFNVEVGYKYKMSGLQAALGLAQIERIDELVAKKREIFSWYQAELQDFAEVSLNPEPEDGINSFWMVTALMDPELNIDKLDLMKRMGENGIDCRPFFHPLSSLPAYVDIPDRERAQAANQASYKLSPRGINLPSALCLEQQQVKRVCQELKRLICSSQL